MKYPSRIIATLFVIFGVYYIFTFFVLFLGKEVSKIQTSISYKQITLETEQQFRPLIYFNTLENLKILFISQDAAWI